MDPELLNGTTSEGIASRDENPKIVLQKPEAHFAEIRGLPDPVDANERHCVRGSFVGDRWVELSTLVADSEEEISGCAGGQDAGDGVRQSPPNVGLDTWQMTEFNDSGYNA